LWGGTAILKTKEKSTRGKPPEERKWEKKNSAESQGDNNMEQEPAGKACLIWGGGAARRPGIPPSINERKESLTGYGKFKTEKGEPGVGRKRLSRIVPNTNGFHIN